MPPASFDILELRQYTLHRGRRDTLIDLFERHFIESQEACGIVLAGTFRDLDDPDRFVWLRGFADMQARGDALPAFYGGPAWRTHREDANATMVDSDDVHLLRPLTPAHRFGPLPPRPSFEALLREPAGLLTATLCTLRDAPDAALAEAFERDVRPAWEDADATLLACWATCPSANNFPRLPVHEGRPVVAWFTRFRDAQAQARHAARIAQGGALRAPAWRARLLAEPHTVRLVPTTRSALR
jgi:quinol monooxygenase YgiN